MRNLLIITFLLFSLSNLSAQSELRIVLGINSPSLDHTFDDFSFSNDLGYQFGADLILGKRLYLNPGFLFEATKSTAKDPNQADETSITITNIRIPVLVGYKLFDNGEDNSFNVRVFTGPNMSFAINQELDEDFSLSKDDFSDIIWGWNVGAGMDFSILFLDLGYSFGLNDVFKNDSGSYKQHLFYANAGVRLRL